MMQRIKDEHNLTVKSFTSKLESLQNEYTKQNTQNMDMKQQLEKLSTNPTKKKIKELTAQNQDLEKQILKLRTDLQSKEDDFEQQ